MLFQRFLIPAILSSIQQQFLFLFSNFLAVTSFSMTQLQMVGVVVSKAFVHYVFLCEEVVFVWFFNFSHTNTGFSFDFSWFRYSSIFRSSLIDSYLIKLATIHSGYLMSASCGKSSTSTCRLWSVFEFVEFLA